jgi:Tfp pilus assembly protein PilX
MNAQFTTRLPARQQGVVLMIALIMLVAMTLAGIALVRSVDTTNIIAGNLAFKQGATSEADTGIEAAITDLQAMSSSQLWANGSTGTGYLATWGSCRGPCYASGQTWDSYWNSSLSAVAKSLPQDSTTLNQVSYVIERLCNATGDPVSTAVDCSQPQTTGASSGSSKGAGVIALLYNSQIYYRITVRVTGPRNTVGYVQSVIAM